MTFVSDFLRSVLCLQGIYLFNNHVLICNRISKESIVDVQATVKESPITIESCTQNKIELLVKQLWVSSESEPQLPLQIEDASRKETEEDETDGLTIRVNQDTRLDNRVLDLRTPTNQVYLISMLLIII